MLKSMTGFGRAEQTVNDKTFLVEIKSLNGKQFEMQLRLPPLLRPYEFDIRAILQEQLPTVKVWNEFKLFAETALDFKELLKLIDPHIHFLRREKTEWDEAFHLYSSLAFFHD
jgi:uncharacterized protein (TIGR00255 family)